MGLFCILDEECMMPKGTDLSFLDKMQKHFSTNALFKVAGKSSFTVQHYAGNVPYEVDGFLEKNKDTLFEDLKDLCLNSNMWLLSTIFQDSSQPLSPKGSTKGVKARPETAGLQFRKSVVELLKALYACQPHYIRTIKPNDEKRPLYFVEERVAEQVRYLGLVENVKVRRAGYCYRTDYDNWLKRYAVISDKTFPTFSGDSRQGVEVLLKELNVSQKDYIFGKTKLFVREPHLLYVMEEARLRALDKIAQRVKSSKCPPKKVEGNVCLEYLRLLIFHELSEFTVTRLPKKGGDKTYKSYQEVEQDYVSGLLEPTELKQSLYQLLTDVAEPIREHFQEKKSAWASFFSFFSRGKTQTAAFSGPQ